MPRTPVTTVDQSVTTVLEKLPSVVTGLKYGGWSKYDFAAMFGISESKAIQKVQYMLPVLGRMWLEDRYRFIAMVMTAANDVLEADPMSAQEFDLRSRLNTGRVDSAEVR